MQKTLIFVAAGAFVVTACSKGGPRRAASASASITASASQAASAKPSPAEPKAPTTFDLAAIDSYVAAKVEKEGFVGLSLAILRDGRIVLAKGYGKSSLETGAPVDTSTAFGIGSVTKQFTCASLSLLAEDGKLSLDDPVAKYYPKLTRANDITLDHVSSHRSGYPDYYPLDFTDRRMRTAIDPDALLATYAGGELDFEPGTRFSYSNTGFVLAARVVERVSGEPFGKFLAARIFGPVGMTHTALEPKDGTSGLAHGYTSFLLGPPEPAPREANGWLGGAGGVFSSASDLALWDLALMDGKVLKPKSWERMTTPRPLAGGRTYDYGCGLGIRRRLSKTILQHSGGVSGFVAQNAMIPEARAAVVLLSNDDAIDIGALHDEILTLLLKDLVDVPKVEGPLPKDVALDVLHQMQSGKIDRTKIGEELSLFLGDERSKSASARLKALGEPTRVDVMSLSERGGMQVAWMKLVFENEQVVAPLYRTPDGKVQEFLLLR